MKNFDESRKRPEDLETDRLNANSRPQSEGEVVSFEERRNSKEENENQLIQKRQMEELRARWTTIQAGFVDEPRKAVQDADELVSAAIKQIEEGFRDQRGQLENQWTQGSDVSTEDFRLSLQRYRAFFERLLSL
jgi:hypothetical protein